MSKWTTADGYWELLENRDKELSVLGRGSHGTASRPARDRRQVSSAPTLTGSGGGTVTKVSRVTVGSCPCRQLETEGEGSRAGSELPGTGQCPCSFDNRVNHSSMLTICRPNGVLLARVRARPASPGHGGCSVAPSTPAPSLGLVRCLSNRSLPTRPSEKPSVRRTTANTAPQPHSESDASASRSGTTEDQAFQRENPRKTE